MLNRYQFITALQFISHAAATNDTRYYLNGVHLVIEQDHILLEATDGHRLAQIKVKLDTNHAFSIGKSYIIKLDDVKLIIKAFKDRAKNNIVYNLFLRPDFEESVIIFDGIDQKIEPRIIDGEFPNTKNVIHLNRSIQPKFDGNIGFKADYMSKACAAFKTLAGSCNGVKMSIIDEHSSYHLTTPPLVSLPALYDPLVVIMPMRL